MRTVFIFSIRAALFVAALTMMAATAEAEGESDTQSNRGSPSDDGATRFNRGNVYLRNGDYDRAIAEYNAALRINSNLTEAYNVGVLQRQYRETIEAIKRAQDAGASPEDIQALNNEATRIYSAIDIAHGEAWAAPGQSVTANPNSIYERSLGKVGGFFNTGIGPFANQAQKDDRAAMNNIYGIFNMDIATASVYEHEIAKNDDFQYGQVIRNTALLDRMPVSADTDYIVGGRVIPTPGAFGVRVEELWGNGRALDPPLFSDTLSEPIPLIPPVEDIAENIRVVSAIYQGEENAAWTSQRARTFYLGSFLELKTILALEHTVTGRHREEVIKAANRDFGIGAGQVSGKSAPLGESQTVEADEFSATDSLFTSLMQEADYRRSNVAALDAVNTGILETIADMVHEAPEDGAIYGRKNKHGWRYRVAAAGARGTR